MRADRLSVTQSLWLTISTPANAESSSEMVLFHLTNIISSNNHNSSSKHNSNNHSSRMVRLSEWSLQARPYSKLGLTLLYSGFYPSSGAAGPALPGMSSMPQGSPNIAQHRPIPPHEAPMPPHSVPPQGQPYSLPGINQTAPGQPHAGHAGFDREREARERELREREFEDQARRERELREREMRERQQREQVGPHQEQLQIHQPVAVGPRMQTAIHGPNGLLASGGPPVPTQQAPAQNPSMSLFGSHFDGAARAALQQSAQMAPQTLLSFGGPGGMSQMSSAPLAPGQQPILNVSIHHAFLIVEASTNWSSRMLSATWTKSKCSSLASSTSTINFWIS